MYKWVEVWKGTFQLVEMTQEEFELKFIEDAKEFIKLHRELLEAIRDA
jgi:hypothetical protein